MVILIIYRNCNNALVEEAKIDIEKPVGNYLDSLPQNWRPVTLSNAQHMIIALQNNQLLKKKESINTMWKPAKLNNEKVKGW